MVEVPVTIFTTETIHNINYSDLDKFIAEQYDLDNFECSVESNNDSYYKFEVQKKELEDWDIEALEELKEAGNCAYYHIGVILQDFINRDILPEGIYLVNVCW